MPYTGWCKDWRTGGYDLVMLTEVSIHAFL